MTANPFESKLPVWQNVIQDCNINFLIGSGLSNPFFGTLGSIETWLTELEKKDGISPDLRTYTKACLYYAYYQVAIKKNIHLFGAEEIPDELFENPKTDDEALKTTYKGYKDFLRSINRILYQRRSNTLSKQVNIFTTNVDIFLEKVIEDLSLNFNDGFNGVFTKSFSLSNFKRSFYQKSLHYDNIAEIPVYNLLKIHGSVTWKLKNTQVIFNNIDTILEVENSVSKLSLLDVVALDAKVWAKKKKGITIDEIISEVETILTPEDPAEFISNYEKLLIINPTKEKFKDTTFNKTYYEMLRMYSNELEKENSILFILGFSLADEHIRDITFRAIRSNPTLKVFISSYSKSAEDILMNLKADKINLKDFHNVELLDYVEKFDLNKFNELVLFPILHNIS